MARIFISYAHEDSGKAHKLNTALSALGHEVWWDDHLRAGERFQDEIEKRLSTVDAVVVLWTQISITKDWVKAEALFAMERSIMVPVRFEHAVRLDGELGQIHVEFLGDWNGDKNAGEMQRLSERIARLKSQSDAARLAKMVPIRLRQTLEDSTSLRVLFDTALPGGLRVHRLILGTCLVSLAVWGAMVLIYNRIGDDDPPGIAVLWEIALLIGLARVFSQICTAGKQRFSDRFFDSSFSFLCLTCLLLGVLISILTLLARSLSLWGLIAQAGAITVYLMAGISALRTALLGIAVLQRRLD